MQYNFKNIISFFFINLFPQLSGFILLKVYTEYLSIEEFGFYNAMISIPALLSVFISFQLHSAISRFYFESNDNRQRKRLIGTILSLVILTASSFTVLLLMFENDFFFLLFDNKFEQYNGLFGVVFLIAFINVCMSAFNSVLIVKELGHVIIKRVALIAFIQVIGIYFSVKYFDGDAFFILYIILFCAVLNLFLVYSQTRRYLVLCLDRTHIKALYSYSVPLVFHQLGGYLFNFSSILILTNKLSIKEVALFAVAFKLASIMKIIVNSLNTAWQPSAFRKLREDRVSGIEYTKNSFNDFFYLIIIIYLFLVQVVNVVVTHWLKTDYHEILNYIPLILGAYLFRLLYCFATTMLFFDKKTRLIPLITFFAGVFNVVFVYMLSDHLGFASGLFAFFLSMFFMCSFYTTYNKIYYKISYLKDYLKIILVLLFSYYVKIQFEFNSQCIIYSILISFIIFIILRKKIIDLSLISKFLRRR